MQFSVKLQIIIRLIIPWAASKYRSITLAYTQDNEALASLKEYTNNTHGDFRENKYDFRQAKRIERQNETRQRSLWDEETSVWGSIHREDDLGLGWVPASFPNPNYDPESCGISSLARGSSTAFAPLYFCDPDKVMSNRDFEIIAEALTNFSSVYGLHDIDNTDIYHNQKPISRDNNHKSWRVLVSHGKTRSLTFNRFNESSLTGLLGVSESGSNSMAPSSTNRGLSINLRHSHKDVVKLKDARNDTPYRSSGFQSLNKSITLGIAIAKKIDVSDILREYSFYSFEDEVDTINDAAEYFARYLLNLWWKRDPERGNYSDGITNNKEASQHINGQISNGVLIFLSVEEQACFITAGNKLSYVLPWWRLENIVNGMKTNLRKKSYSDALLCAIDEITATLESGPPTASERAHDFLARFGFVIAFTLLTFCMALCGEYRDRQMHLKSVENRSEMNSIEKKKAKLLQSEFKTTECPICLESFGSGQDSSDKVDKYNIPLKGNDGLPLKILRCGHIFDLSCWRTWVDSDYGNSEQCPVCRQDIACSYNEFSQSLCSSQNSRVSNEFPGEEESMFSLDELTIEYDLNDSLSQRDRLLSFDSGIEVGSTLQTPQHSYGSMWTS